MAAAAAAVGAVRREERRRDVEFLGADVGRGFGVDLAVSQAGVCACV